MDIDGAFLHLIYVVLLAITSAIVFFIFYHCVLVSWCNRRHPSRTPPSFFPQRGPARSIDLSLAQFIPPASMYGKGEGMVNGGESTCAVCLSDFKDGEAIRLLPECLHFFHVGCIDDWLQSHRNCPMCRANTVPLPQHSPVSAPELGRG